MKSSKKKSFKNLERKSVKIDQKLMDDFPILPKELREKVLKHIEDYFDKKS